MDKPLLALLCPHCASDAVAATTTQDAGPSLAHVRVRCGECGRSRQSVMTAAIAARFEQHVEAGRAAIRRALEHLERGLDLERVAAAQLR
jgi:hypothetical protein